MARASCSGTSWGSSKRGWCLAVLLVCLCFLQNSESFTPQQQPPREHAHHVPFRPSPRGRFNWALKDAAKPFWEVRPTRPFNSIREVKAAAIDLNGADIPIPTPDEDPRAAMLSELGFELRRAGEDAGFAVLDAGSGPGSKARRDSRIILKGFVWFLSLLSGHIAFGLCCSIAAEVLSTSNGGDGTGLGLPMWDLNDSLPDLQRIHQLIGTILGFSIGFRTNAAYDRFYEGRKILCTIMESCRSIIRDAYSYVLKPGGGGDEEEVALVCGDVRRRLDVLFAFIRHSVRESVLGFSPGTGMRHVPFTEETYFLDPCRPQLIDLLTPAEAERYSHIPPSSRPSTVCSEINIILQMLGTRFQFTDGFVNRQQIHLHQIMEAHATAVRIRDTPLPYPYVIILSIATFVFVYSTPFIYQAGFEGRYLGVQFLICCYYGILQIGQSIENPFAFESFDIDMEAFAKRLRRDTMMTAQGVEMLWGYDYQVGGLQGTREEASNQEKRLDAFTHTLALASLVVICVLLLNAGLPSHRHVATSTSYYSLGLPASVPSPSPVLVLVRSFI